MTMEEKQAALAAFSPQVPSGYGEYFAETESRTNAFLSVGSTEARPESLPDTMHAGQGEAAASPVLGLPFAVKDNIAVEGHGLTCASRILEGFVSPYSATAVRKLVAAGAFVLGKTNMDEFGMGSSTDNSAFQKTDNPWAAGRVPGGSSGGSAAAVAAGLVPFALGSDTGGSVRQPASFCGVVGLKPTYGAISRFGLVAYASSLETIGIIGDSVSRVKDVFGIVKGEDPLDQTSRSAPGAGAAAEGASGPLAALSGAALSGAALSGAVLSQAALSAQGGAAADPEAAPGSGRKAPAGRDGQRPRVGVLAVGEGELDPAVASGYRMARATLEGLGYSTVEVGLPTLEYVVPAYYTIATAEASANLARYNGIRYGVRAEGAENPDDLIVRTRGRGFGDEVKLRILLGTFVLRSGFQDRFYVRAQKVRTAIRNDFARAFAGCDLLLMPVFPVQAWARGEGEMTPFQQKAADRYTCAANLAGLPALALPAGVEGGLPVGVQLTAPEFCEDLLFSVGLEFEAALPAARPAGFRAFWR